MLHLPKAKSVTVAGRYAKIEGLEDDINRFHRNISFWYYSDALGWMEIIRERSSDYPADYKLSHSGIEMDWSFTRRSASFYIEAGLFPPDLIDGSRYFALGRHDGRLVTKKGIVDLPSNRISESDYLSSSSAVALGYSNYRFLTKNGLTINVTTEDTSPVPTQGQQVRLLGGWSLLARSGVECFLHAYYPDGEAVPVRIRTVITVNEPGTRN
jgi:hypothetical protein